MKQSNTVKQIIIIVTIIFAFLICVLYVKGKYFPTYKEPEINSSIGKDKYEYNEFKLVDASVELMCQRYFIDFKNKLIYNIKDAYEELDSDTKSKYSNYKEFESYILNNQEKFYSAYIKKYSTRSKGNKKVYVVVDQYDMVYTFESSAVLVYKVNLKLGSENSSIFG